MKHDDSVQAAHESWWGRRLTPAQAGAAFVIGLVLVGGSTVAFLRRSPSTVGIAAASFEIPATPSDEWSKLLAGAGRASSRIPLDEIHRGGPPKDGIPALTSPAVTSAGAAGRLRPEDRVVGVTVNGESRAYPIRILNWHEIVNDTLGGRSLAVTYCPLCDSVVVFDRDIGGTVREFGVSGLLYNSNVLMYDRQAGDSQESLWSQLTLKAVVGVAAERGLELRPMPAQFVTWASWMEENPGTTVLSFETGHRRNYDLNPYEDYFGSPQLMFPVKPAGDPASDLDALPPKERAIVILADDKLRAYPVSRLDAALKRGESDAAGGLLADGLLFKPDPSDRASYSVVAPDGSPAAAAFSFWFAFRAMHPGADVFSDAIPDSGARSPGLPQGSE